MKVGYAKDQWFMLLTNSRYSFFTHPESAYVQFSREMYPLLLPKTCKISKNKSSVLTRLLCILLLKCQV